MSRETQKEGFPITALRETNVLLSLHHPNIVRVSWSHYTSAVVLIQHCCVFSILQNPGRVYRAVQCAAVALHAAH
jgi:hypothetical protein